MVMLGESWSVSNLIHSPHEHPLSQSTVCIDLEFLKLLYVYSAEVLCMLVLCICFV
ncbi:hypothetical protein Hanom_Chr01g00069771 [Helianthus anomalus]